MTDGRKTREITPELSRRYSQAAKRNNSPWRRGPNVKKAQNHKRYQEWQS